MTNIKKIAQIVKILIGDGVEGGNIIFRPLF